MFPPLQCPVQPGASGGGSLHLEVYNNQYVPLFIWPIISHFHKYILRYPLIHYWDHMRLASELTWFMQMPSVSCLLFGKAEQQRKHSGRKNVHFCRFREERNKYNGAYYVILYEMKCLAVSYLHRFTIRVIGAEWSELCCVPSCVCVTIPLLTRFQMYLHVEA